MRKKRQGKFLATTFFRVMCRFFFFLKIRMEKELLDPGMGAGD
ncbi:hypothetical protein HMPREF3213_01611 [Heyndrickxia coagulans]|uniref:Uncharacterized protein n=1 Tax=Heyndrickxia coagulans TaxID=1398 RepID=A0A0C5C3Z5_HEYCO|nr:hypothetical protein SB48_HM08orf00836 [Heyndrickxia coagulans]KWZ82766.1 hypothetical protein HMPREF3213_01611 [Heyndrickxia coagulans]